MSIVRLDVLPVGDGSGRHARLHVGARAMTVPVHLGRPRMPHGPGTLAVPAAVFQQLPLLLPGQEVGLWQANDGANLHLGPVVGIIWDGPGFRSRLTESPPPPYREMINHLRTGAQDAGVIPFFCSILMVNQKRRTIVAHLPTRGSDWQTFTVPLPDVFYNRGTYPDLKARQRAKRIRLHLSRVHGIPQVNSIAACGKLDTYRALQFFPATRNVMPPTTVFAPRPSALSFITAHQRVFLKADSGSWGRQVMKIDCSSAWAPGCRLTGYHGGDRISVTMANKRSLLRRLKSLCHGEVWLMQRAIGRYRFQDRIFDLRIVLQKDDHGVWQIPHVLVNWAHRGEAVANRPETSEFLTAAEFIKQWGIRSREFTAMVNRARDMAHLVAAVLEARFGMLGELGLDIGIDPQGRPWLFEANAKPFFFPGEGNRYPFLYARYLAQASWSARYTAGRQTWPPSRQIPVQQSV